MRCVARQPQRDGSRTQSPDPCNEYVLTRGSVVHVPRLSPKVPGLLRRKTGAFRRRQAGETPACRTSMTSRKLLFPLNCGGFNSIRSQTCLNLPQF